MESFAYSEMAQLEADHWWFRGRRRVLKAILDRFVYDKDLNILEVGCGTGGNFELLSQYGKLTGYEPSQEAQKYLNGHSAVETVQAGFPLGEHLKENSYDLVVSLDVLEHIEDDKAAARELYEMTKVGGKILIMVPAFQFLFSSHDKLHSHYRRYSEKQILDCFAGLKVKKNYSSYFNTFLFPISLTMRILDKVFTGAGSVGMKTPHFLINGMLYSIMAFECFLMKFLKLPFGLSVAVLFTKE